MQRLYRSQQLIHLYQNKLKLALKMFYEQIGDDEQKNEELYKNCNLAWKRTINNVNRTQKHTVLDPFAFEKEVEKYKQIALEKAISQQENGHDQNEIHPDRASGTQQGAD